MSASINNVRNLGLDVPADAVALADLAQALRAIPHGVADPTAVLLGEYRAGKLSKLTPAKLAERVTRAVADDDQRRATRTVAVEVAKRVDADAEAALRGQAERIITDYRPHFAAAAQTLTDAREFGITAESTAHDATQLGLDAARVFIDVTNASKVLDAARGLVIDVTGTSGFALDVDRFLNVDSLATVGVRRSDAFHVWSPLEHAKALYSTPGHNKWLALIEAGFTLRLNATDGEVEAVRAHDRRLVTVATTPASITADQTNRRRAALRAEFGADFGA